MQGVDFDHNGYYITSDKALLQPHAVHEWLSAKSHWAIGIPFETVRISMEHSFCVGALKDGLQIGFARFTTDYAVFGYLADVYVEAEHRKNDLAKAMCGAIMQLDWVQSLRRIMLATKDAHTIYAPLGFGPLHYPERMMEIFRLDLYQQ